MPARRFTAFFKDIPQPFLLFRVQWIGMANTSRMPAPNPVSGFFLAVIAAAIVLTILIAVIPSDLFLALSNYLQIIAALAGASVLLYACTTGRRKVLLRAGTGFGYGGLQTSGGM